MKIILEYDERRAILMDSNGQAVTMPDAVGFTPETFTPRPLAPSEYAQLLDQGLDKAEIQSLMKEGVIG